MQIEFTILDLPPMPRNRSHQPIGNRLIKTELARAFEKDLSARLNDLRDQFQLFSYQYVPSKHYIKAEIVIFTPRDNMITKSNSISQHSTDFDAHKLFVDVIFKSLDLNDKLIRDARIVTPISKDDKWNYHITLEFRPIEELENLCTYLKTTNIEESANLL